MDQIGLRLVKGLSLPGLPGSCVPDPMIHLGLEELRWQYRGGISGCVLLSQDPYPRLFLKMISISPLTQSFPE